MALAEIEGEARRRGHAQVIVGAVAATLRPGLEMKPGAVTAVSDASGELHYAVQIRFADNTYELRVHGVPPLPVEPEAVVA